MESWSLRVIARMHSGFRDKFGIPRQSGRVETLPGTIVFEPEYRNPDALEGLEEFTHLWILWGFSETQRDSFHATVRPPRLGGNETKGVFATRSPYRPNPIGLSCVRLIGIDSDEEHGTVLRVLGADLMDGTPIYDIKPYLPYTDAHPEAASGFADREVVRALEVSDPGNLLQELDPDLAAIIKDLLAEDPRPSYQKKNLERVYGMFYGDLEIRFQVADGTAIIRSIAHTD